MERFASQRRMIGDVQAKTQFPYRILLVDTDNSFLERFSGMLGQEGFDVIKATDGFAGLCAFRGAIPNLLITELNLPRMSGFELLSIVRSRFPEVGVIALSTEYSAASMPTEVICDAFLQKGTNLEFELLEEVRTLLKGSPLRGSRPKSDKALVWIPSTGTGYLVLTCPECLRSFPALEPKSGAAKETCACCGAEVPFEMSSVQVPPVQSSSTLVKSRLMRTRSQQVRARRPRRR